jgi:hypothetical protein
MSFMPHPLYAWGKAKITHGTAGWVVPTASLTLCREKNLFSCPGDEPNCLVGQPIAYLLHQSIFSEIGTVNMDVS